MPTRVLITGSAGYLGSKIVDILAAQGGYEIYGIDLKVPANRAAYREFVKGSVTDPSAITPLFGRARPEVAVHLAFVVDVTHHPRREEEIALGGTRRFLDGCNRADTHKVVALTSVAAYGAHDDNDQPLTERSPIRGVPGYSYSWLKAAADELVQAFMRAHADRDVVLLRPCLFVGPNTRNHFFDLLHWPMVPRVRDRKGVRDPQFQFIHEDDMAACVVAAVERPVRGIFNVAGEGTEPFSALVKRCGKRGLPLSAWLLYPAAKLLWAAHLIASPPAQLDFIRYPWTMDCTRMRAELFTPKYTSAEAFDAFVRTHKF